MFTGQTRYVMNLLLHLAHRFPDAYRTIDAVVEETELPRPYLSQLVGTLEKLGILDTKKGPGGGIKLAHAPEEISLRTLFEDLGELEHHPGEDPCCEASPFPTCYIGQLICTMRENVIGEETLQDALEHVQESTSMNGPATAS